MRTSKNQAELNNITASVTTPYVLEKSILITFAYRFPAVQVLRFVSDELDGRWRLATQGVDYNIEFFGGNIMRIELYASGSYKVNY